jgi:hypothetical protein
VSTPEDERVVVADYLSQERQANGEALRPEGDGRLSDHLALLFPDANAAREEQIAKRLAGAAGLVVLILGGGHDLTAALKRQAANLRDLRVATKAYQEAAGE